MSAPFRSFSDPALEQLDFARGQGQLGIGWGHAEIGIVAENALDQLALGWVAGNDGSLTVALGKDALLDVESQVAFPFGLVRAMTLVAAVGENRLNVAAKIDRRLGG